jgi:hypothetical protein
VEIIGREGQNIQRMKLLRLKKEEEKVEEEDY